MHFYLLLEGCSTVLPKDTKNIFAHSHTHHSRKIFWYLRISRRITQGRGFTSRVTSDQVVYVLWSQPIKRPVDNCARFFGNRFIDGLPYKSLYKCNLETCFRLEPGYADRNLVSFSHHVIFRLHFAEIFFTFNNARHLSFRIAHT